MATAVPNHRINMALMEEGLQSVGSFLGAKKQAGI